MHDNLSSQAIVVKYCLPRSLPHVLPLIDEYLSPIVHHKIFTAACERGESLHVLERIHRWVCPDWRDAVCAAVRGGHLHVLRWMVELGDGRGPWKRDFNYTLEDAAKYGYLDVVQWLYKRGVDYHKFECMDGNRAWLFKYRATTALEMAAEHGHLEIVQWIYNVRTGVVNWCDVIDSAIDKAVSNGHLAIVQWLYNTRTRHYYPRTAQEAAQKGHLTMLQWLHSNDLLARPADKIYRAARNGHLDVLKWFHEICGEIRLRQDSCLAAIEALCWAASNGHLEVVEWIYGNVTKDIPMDDVWWVNKAAKGGHLNVLKWISIHFPGTFSKDTMDDAAEGGHLDVVVWLHEYTNKGFTRKALYWASHNGHLRVLQRLYAYNSEIFNSSVWAILMDMDSLGDVAARNGPLEIVQWLNENDCGGFTKGAMSSAAENGHLNVVLYLLEHRSEGFRSDAMTRPEDIEVLCTQTNMLQSIFKSRPSFVQGCLRCLAEIALRTSNIKILDWVNQFGLELRSTAPIRTTVYQGHVTLLQWFHRNGFEVSEPDLLKVAVQNDHLDTARWLSKHGYEINSLDLVDMARSTCDIRLLRWIVEYGPPLDFQMARKLVMNEYVESLWWVSESDRVRIFLHALKYDDRRVLWWILTRTRFEDEASRQIIRDGIHGASTNTLLWIQDNLVEFEDYSWCFTTDESTTVTTETRAAKKLKRSLPSL